VQAAILSPVDAMKQLIGAPVKSQPRAEAEPELDALRRRVAELEARLKKNAQRKQGRKRKGRV